MATTPKLEVYMFQKWIFELTVIILMVTGLSAHAQVDVPEDELARESVYPVFDRPTSVRNRNIQDSETFDVGMFGGLALTEPIQETTKLGLTLNYHFNETHMLGILYAMNSHGLSRDAKGLRDSFYLDYGRAPYPEYTLMADYNYKLFYGKMSITKQGVLNTSIYGSASLGMVKYVHKTYPAIALGIGERFYFGKHFSLKIDLRLYAHQAPIPFKSDALQVPNPSKPAGDPVPSYDSFDERLTYTTNLDIGLNYLF